MNRPVLIALTLALLLFSAGCAKNLPDKQPGDATKAEKASVEKAVNYQSRENPESGGKSSSTPAPEIVVKTDNRVSNQEASAMLDEVDRQLSDLLNTLDRLDDVDDKDLHY